MISRIQQPKLAFWFAVAGAFSFWFPDVALHIVAGRSFDTVQARVVTFMLPVTCLCAYLILRRFALRRSFRWLAAVMLLGVWLTGGLFMAIAATPSGGGFAAGGVRGGLFMAVLGTLPPVTYMMSAYDGSLFALLAVTATALLIWRIRDVASTSTLTSSR